MEYEKRQLVIIIRLEATKAKEKFVHGYVSNIRILVNMKRDLNIVKKV